MVVHVASYCASCALHFAVFRVLVDSLFLCVFFMEEHDLVEEGVDVQRSGVFHECHWVLSVEIEHNFATEIALPVHFHQQIVVSWVQLDPHCAVAVAVHEIVHVPAQIASGLVDFQDNQSAQGILVGFAELAVVLLDERNESFGSLGGAQEYSFELAASRKGYLSRSGEKASGMLVER